MAKFRDPQDLGRRAAEPVSRTGFRGGIDLLLALNVAKSLKDLSPLKSVGLHKLKGDRKGQWAMTVNERWRICFEFRKATLSRSKSSTITGMKDHGSGCPSRPPAEA